MLLTPNGVRMLPEHHGDFKKFKDIWQNILAPNRKSLLTIRLMRDSSILTYVYLTVVQSASNVSPTRPQYASEPLPAKSMRHSTSQNTGTKQTLAPATDSSSVDTPPWARPIGSNPVSEDAKESVRRALVFDHPHAPAKKSVRRAFDYVEFPPPSPEVYVENRASISETLSSSPRSSNANEEIVSDDALPPKPDIADSSPRRSSSRAHHIYSYATPDTAKFLAAVLLGAHVVDGSIKSRKRSTTNSQMRAS